MSKNKEKNYSKNKTADDLVGKIVGEALKALPPVCKTMLKNGLYLWKSVPLFGGASVWICFSSNAPTTFGKFQISSRSLAISNQSVSQHGGFTNLSVKTSLSTIHVSLMMLLTVVVPLQKVKFLIITRC